MQITEITVTYQETCNLGNYSNVKPSVTLRASVESSDDAYEVREHLLQQAREAVQREIDDALEASDQPAKYSTDPRYDVLSLSYDQCTYLLIVPHNLRLPEPHRTYRSASDRRIVSARRFAADYAGDHGGHAVVIFECLDGNLVGPLAVLDPVKAEEDRKEAEKQARWKAQQEEQQRRYAAEQEERKQQIEAARAARALGQAAPVSSDEDDDDDEDEDEESDDE